MTIREFALICRCNPQTLRHYDHIDLLKPASVDPWSGYRYYEKEQALDFVKIKNLQSAGFSTREIRELLDKDDSTVVDAIDGKLREMEEKLWEIQNVRDSYLTEMDEVKEIIYPDIDEIIQEIQTDMNTYDAETEFGIDRETYEKIRDDVNQRAESDRRRLKDLQEAMKRGEEPASEPASPEYFYRVRDYLRNPDYEPVYTNHSWSYVKEFYGTLTDLMKTGGEYVLLFELREEKTQTRAFFNTLLSCLLSDLPEEVNKKMHTCSEHTLDDKNHFWLLRKK